MDVNEKRKRAWINSPKLVSFSKRNFQRADFFEYQDVDSILQSIYLSFSSFKPNACQ